jgi:hypothetical protein
MRWLWLNVGAWISATVGVASGLAMLLVAFEHNPQGALINHGTGEVNVQHALLIFFSWFLAAGIATGILLTVAWAIGSAVVLAGRAMVVRVVQLLPWGRRASGGRDRGDADGGRKAASDPEGLTPLPQYARTGTSAPLRSAER